MIITHHVDRSTYTVEFSDKELNSMDVAPEGIYLEQLIIKLTMLASEHRNLLVFDAHREPVVGAGFATHLNQDDEKMPTLAVQIY